MQVIGDIFLQQIACVDDLLDFFDQLNVGLGARTLRLDECGARYWHRGHVFFADLDNFAPFILVVSFAIFVARKSVFAISASLIRLHMEHGMSPVPCDLND